MGDQPVQHQPRKECAKDTLHSYKFHQPCPQEYHGKHKDELHYIIIVPTEEPTTDTGEKIHDQSAKENDFDHQPYPKQSTGFSLKHTTYYGQHQQRKCISHRCTSYGNTDTPMSGYTIPDNNGICYQSM